MDAICCDKEEEKNPLKASKCHICCHKEGGGGAWGEDGLEEIGKEGRHSFSVGRVKENEGSFDNADM
jgi:hypothetical protein